MSEWGADQWIVIPNWDKFQHYGDRRPVWIKVYTNLLDNPRFLGLTGKQRGVLFSIWLLYAASDCEVPYSASYIVHRIGGITEWEYRKMREGGESDVRALREAREFVVRGSDLKALEQANFIGRSASKSLAQNKSKSNKDLVASQNQKSVDNSAPLRDPEAVQKIKDLASRIGQPL